MIDQICSRLSQLSLRLSLRLNWLVLGASWVLLSLKIFKHFILFKCLVFLGRRVCLPLQEEETYLVSLDHGVHANLEKLLDYFFFRGVLWGWRRVCFYPYLLKLLLDRLHLSVISLNINLDWVFPQAHLHLCRVISFAQLQRRETRRMHGFRRAIYLNLDV
jgi:hypothetical protein